MKKINPDENILDKLGIKILAPSKKYSYLGFSPSLIDYFIIIRYDLVSKTEIANNLLSTKNLFSQQKSHPIDKEREINYLSLTFQVENKPVVLNSTGIDLVNAALNEELIIEHVFPNKLVYDFFGNCKK